jgi:hypothetical protein
MLTIGQKNMKSKTFTAIDHEELSALIAGLFGWGSKTSPYNVVADLSENDPRWRNDSVHVLYVEDPPSLLDKKILRVITVNGRIEYSYQLESVVKRLMQLGVIPIGNVLIEVCW